LQRINKNPLSLPFKADFETYFKYKRILSG
jgi:hypothetical protein